MSKSVNKFVNYITYSTILSDCKPDDPTIIQLQDYKNSYVEAVTPKDLAVEIKNGRSYHPAIFKKKSFIHFGWVWLSIYIFN